MKRLATLLLAAGLILGGANSNSASAVEIQAGGHWQFGLSWMDNSFGHPNNTDRFYAKQRIRPEFRFVADENLSATLQFEIGTGNLGNDGWALGNDGNTVKVRYGYVDWKVPAVDAQVRMGMQFLMTPAATFAPVTAVDAAGIALSSQFNENVGLSLWWMRPYNSDTGRMHDVIDLFQLAFPIKGEGISVTPWAMYGTIGKDATTDYLNIYGLQTGNGSPSGKLICMLGGLLPVNAYPNEQTAHGDAYWLGVAAELTHFDPLKIALDLNYGKSRFGNINGVNAKREGWMAIGQASYKTDWFTPTLSLWYSTGDDENVNNGSERMPTAYMDAYGTNFGMDGGWWDTCYTAMDLTGTWGVGLWLDGFSFVDKLSHNIRLTYYQGTNHTDAVRRNQGFLGNFNTFFQDNAMAAYLSTSDKMLELNFENKWQVYKNFSVDLEAGIVWLKLEENVWGRDTLNAKDRRIWKVAVYGTYKF